MLGPDDRDELRDDLVDGAAGRVDREMRLAIVRLAPAKERDDLVFGPAVEHRARAVASGACEQISKVTAQPDDETEGPQRFHHAVAARQAPAGGDDVVGLQRERLDGLGFELPKARLAMTPKDLRNRAAFGRDDHVVDLDEASAETAREDPSAHGLPRPHESHQDDVASRHIRASYTTWMGGSGRPPNPPTSAPSAQPPSRSSGPRSRSSGAPQAPQRARRRQQPPSRSSGP